MNTCVLVVAKAPVPGLAKTRLCPPLSDEQAADLAAASLLDTLDTVLATPGTLPVVAFTGELAGACRAAELRRYLDAVPVLAQRGDGFAARLAHAHQDAAARYPGLPILQIGMDTPQLHPGRLRRACELVHESGAVLGPAEDGGWWALGLRDPRAARVLAHVPMSRADTGMRTREALRNNGWHVRPLDTLSDVDTYDDALRVAGFAGGARFAAAVPRLRAVR